MAEQIEQAARTAGRTFNISLAELAGANAGQRNDLLALNQAVYRVPDGTLYTSTGAQLVPAQGLPVMAGTNPLTGGIELSAGGQVISVGGSGINPDATGSLANRSTHNTEAVGFVYMATDQTPAQYFFREGASGNWSAAVEVQGPAGAAGAAGAPGAAGATGATGETFVSGTTAPNNADGRPNGTIYVRYTA